MPNASPREAHLTSSNRRQSDSTQSAAQSGHGAPHLKDSIATEKAIWDADSASSGHAVPAEISAQVACYSYSDDATRSDTRRVGKACVRTCRSGWGQDD